MSIVRGCEELCWPGRQISIWRVAKRPPGSQQLHYSVFVYFRISHTYEHLEIAVMNSARKLPRMNSEPAGYDKVRFSQVFPSYRVKYQIWLGSTCLNLVW